MRLTRPLVIVLAGAITWTACAPGPVEPAVSPTQGPAATQGAEGPTAAERPTEPPSEMKWSRIADIPTPRSEVAATVFQQQIYVVGGFGGPNVVERYDPKADRWTREPDLPTGVDHPMAASIEGIAGEGLYVIGGNSGGRPSARVFRLAPGASSWQEVAAMPRPRSAAAAVTIFIPERNITPRVVVVGGATDGRLDPETFVYDPTKDSWTVAAPIPTPRDHLAAAVMFSKACAVGGRMLSMTRNVGALECYDVLTDTWERLPPAPTPRGGVGAASAGKALFLIGGEQPSGTFDEVEIYDPFKQTWRRGPDLPTARHGIGVVAIAGRIFVMTGGPTPGGSQTAVNEVLEIYSEFD